MKSLFDQSENQRMRDRINSLTPETKALWGKMNVAQMLAHCQPPLKVAIGELKLKRGIIGMLLGGFAKKKLTKEDKPFGRNLPTDPSFVVADLRDFEKEKTALLDLVNRFGETGQEGLSKDPHPFFGKLEAREWDILQWKHLDHHLNQFGV